ncbi:MAG: nuclear transport factor 2 family protein [Actinomycetota bacterium]
MINNTDLVHRYLSAIDPTRLDTDALAALLAPEVVIDDLLMPLTGADTFIEAITTAPPSPMTSTIQEVIGDDGAGLASARVLVEIAGRAIQYHQWFWIEDGRITRIEVLYDPRPFLELAAEQPA